MFKDKRYNLLFSFAIAVVLWAYVIGQINPSTTKTFNNIKINLENQGALENRGLAVESITHDAINVTVKGERSRIQNLRKEDIYAEADVSTADLGSNELVVNVKTPEKVTLENKNMSKSTVIIGELVSEFKPVKIHYSGSRRAGEEPYTVSVNPEKVSVKGARGNVDKVVEVVAKVPQDQVRDKETLVETQLIPVDKNGNVVNWVTLETSKAKIKSVITKTKKVELEVSIQGNNPGVKVEVPEYIIVKGFSDAVKGLTKIQTEAIDVSGYEQNTTVDIKPILPEGVKVASGNNLKAKIIVEGIESKNISFDKKDIEINGLGEGLNADVLEQVSILVEGKKSVLADISKEDFSLSIDLQGLTQGTHQVSVKVTNKKAIKKYTVKPEKVEVEIK
ncbi:YbbR-like domain-containing protein [Eubacteriales bacterium KG127]